MQCVEQFVFWCILVCLPRCAVFGMQSVPTSRVYLWPPLSCLRPSGASLPAQASSLRYFVLIWNNFVEHFCLLLYLFYFLMFSFSLIAPFGHIQPCNVNSFLLIQNLAKPKQNKPCYMKANHCYLLFIALNGLKYYIFPSTLCV